MTQPNLNPKNVRMVIELNLDTGGVSVSGPIQDKVFCYGLLEMARQAVEKFEAPKIQVPAIMVPGSLKPN